MRKIFLWIKHYDSNSLKRVKKTFDKFCPDIIGLELDKTRLEKIKNHKSREKSEMFYAAEYSKENNCELIFLDNFHDVILKDMISSISIVDFFKIFFNFMKSNLLKLFKFQRLRKLKVADTPAIKDAIIRKRDILFIKEIKIVLAKHPNKKVLFIFGANHREGILKGL